MLLLFVAWIAGCVHRPLVPSPPPRAPSIYDVAVAAGHGHKMITSLYTLEIVPAERGLWHVRTLHSEGTWEEGGQAIAFNSRAPQRSDPWMLTLQHAISSAPAQIQFSEGGRPERMVDEQEWLARGRTQLHATDLPPQAIASAGSLLDADGVIRDLRRSFPGQPVEGTWTRDERIAGVEVKRVESCTASRDGDRISWSCVGELQGPERGSAALLATSCSTTLTLDRRGLVALREEYGGTLYQVTATGLQIDRPVVGMRSVARRGDASELSTHTDQSEGGHADPAR